MLQFRSVPKRKSKLGHLHCAVYPFQMTKDQRPPRQKVSFQLNVNLIYIHLNLVVIKRFKLDPCADSTFSSVYFFFLCFFSRLSSTQLFIHIIISEIIWMCGSFFSFLPQQKCFCPSANQTLFNMMTTDLV